MEVLVWCFLNHFGAVFCDFFVVNHLVVSASLSLGVFLPAKPSIFYSYIFLKIYLQVSETKMYEAKKKANNLKYVVSFIHPQIDKAAQLLTYVFTFDYQSA